MSCPKCKAKIGVMKHEIVLGTGIVQVTRCVICGYWAQPYQPYTREHKVRQNEATM